MVDYPHPLSIHVVIDNITTGGGIERVSSVLLPMLAEEHKVKVLGLLDVNKTSVYSFPDNLTIVPLATGSDKSQSAYISSLSRAFKIIKSDRPDIVLLLSMGRLSVFASPFIAIDRKKSTQTRYIACEHISFSSHSSMIRFLKRITFPAYDDVLFLTKRDVEHFRNKSKFGVMLNPAPFPAVKEHRVQVREKLALGIGHLIHRKGFDLLVKAWAEFIREHSDWKLLIVGEGPERENLQKSIDMLGISDSCSLYGSCQDIASLYKRADLMVMTSRSEGLPMTLIEAQSFGLPIVAFDCETGPREIVTQGKNGFLVEPFDINAFATAMHHAVNDSVVYTSLSQGACQSAVRFDQNVIKSEWQKLFAVNDK